MTRYNHHNFFDSQDLLFYGPLDKCSVCNGSLEFDGRRYACRGFYSEWASCIFSTRNPPRKQEPIKLPDSIKNSLPSDVTFSLLLILFFLLFVLHFCCLQPKILSFFLLACFPVCLPQLLKKYQDPSHRPHRDLGLAEKPFTGMMISLMGRLTRTHVRTTVTVVALIPFIDWILTFCFWLRSIIGKQLSKSMEEKWQTLYLVL